MQLDKPLFRAGPLRNAGFLSDSLAPNAALMGRGPLIPLPPHHANSFI